MKMGEVRKLAKDAGISSFGKTKVDLIRAIQRHQGYFDCYGTAHDFCDQMDCCFREACFAEYPKGGHKRDVEMQA
jgi:hypothetical protein